MEPNDADRKAALEWYAKKYPNSSLFADDDGPGSLWGRDRRFTVDGFIAGMRAERERCAKVAESPTIWFREIDVVETNQQAVTRMIAAAIRKGPQQ